MAIVELVKQGKMKHVISQNIDGLHRKSGVPAENLGELHGNTNLEICIKCGKDYMRDFRVRTANKAHEHITGRKCEQPNCGGDLKDTIINFGESLNPAIIGNSQMMAMQSDVMICMGSSMRVSPANMLAGVVGLMGSLVIINL